MKIKLFKTLDNGKDLHSPVFACYIIVFAPLITILLGLISWALSGTYEVLGSMTRQIYIFAFIFPLLFFVLDLYPLILKQRKFEGVKSTISNHPELFILLCFLIWNIIATLLQMKIFGHSRAYTSRIQPRGVQEGLFAFVIYGLCVLMAFWVKDNRIMKNVLVCFIVTAFSLSFLALIDPFSKFIIHSIGNSSWPSVFLNSNHFSYYLTLATALSAMGIILSRVRWKWILSIVLFAFFSVMMLIVDTFGSNLAVFGIFVLIPIILSLFKQKFDWKYLLPLLIFSVCSFAIMPFVKQINSNCTNFFSQFVNLIKEFFVVASAPTSTEAAQAGTNRWELWMYAFNEIKDSPLIGTGNVFLRPHNEYLQFAQVWGIPSLIIYLSAFVVILVKAIKRRKTLSDLSLTLLFCVLAFLSGAIFGNTMPHTTPFFALFLGFTIRELNRKKTEASI